MALARILKIAEVEKGSEWRLTTPREDLSL